MSPRNRTPHLTFHPIVIASVVVFIIVFLALGYHTGVRDTERGFQPRLSELSAMEAQLKSDLAVCKADASKLVVTESSNNAVLQQLRHAVSEMETAQQEEEASYKAVDEKRQNCTRASAEVQVKLDQQLESDNLIRLEVEELKRDIDALRLSIAQATRGEGMSVIMLNEGLAQMRLRYTTRCSKTPGCVVRTDAELLERWTNTTENEEALRRFLERDEEAQRAMTNHTVVGPAANFTDINFLPTLAEEDDAATLAYPLVYFNRSILEKPLRGVDVNPSRPRTHRVMAAMERFTDYALCAYRHQNPNYVFQSPFLHLPAQQQAELPDGQQHQSKPQGQLHKLFASPLVRYCIQCNADAWRRQFRLACLRDQAASHYGSHDFWAARSLIQPTAVVRNAAFHYYEGRDWLQKNILVVMLHQSINRDSRECDRAVDRAYGLHYLYLKANFPNETNLQQHISDNRGTQCNPSLQEVIAHIATVRKQAPHAIDHVYISMVAEQRSTLEALLGADDPTGLLPLLLPVFADAEAEAAMPGFTELVDLEIASRATYLVINPFISTSRYVTENFLLRHHLQPDGRIWTF